MDRLDSVRRDLGAGAGLLPGGISDSQVAEAVNDTLSGIALVAFILLLCTRFYRWGKEAGYDQCRKDEAHFWMKAWEGTDEEREKIWREERTKP